jgi:2-amino-4-hydroxy-6-hydroxymethyldihydropteridine diphosphokinase
MQTWWPAYIGIGSNLEDPRRQVLSACRHLQSLPLTRLVLVSPLYASAPLGSIAQPDFVNAVAGVLTRLDADALLEELRGVETALGRPALRERWGPRIIDREGCWCCPIPG